VHKNQKPKKTVCFFRILFLFAWILGELTVSADEVTIPPAQVEKQTETAQARTYIVQKGDTLWGISSNFLRDPFYWPKLWKENKFIVNPDLIYPGNTIAMPTEQEIQEALKKLKEEAVPPAEEKAPEEAVVPPMPTQPPTVETEMPPSEVKAPANPPTFIDQDFILSSGFIRSGVKSSGIVIASTDPKEMYGEHDTVYLLPSTKPSVGDRLTAYRVVRKVFHPKTGQYLGDLIRILGTMEVTEVQDKTATAVVARSFDVIVKGDRYYAFQPVAAALEVNDIQSGPHLDGYIVAVKETKVYNAQFDVVYIDKGRRDGVLAGRDFLIFREGKKMRLSSLGREVQLPRRQVGKLQVIAVQDETSVGRIVRSSDPITRGDMVETPESR